MKDAAVKVDSNVIIKILDENNHIIRVSKMHNKATMHMVTGLLEFLSGAFNAVSTNKFADNTDPVAITSYIPVKLQLGNVGVKMKDRKTSKPLFTGINRSEFKIPTFDDYRLQNNITQYYTDITGLQINFDTISITSFDDPNNSMGLLLQTKLPAGRLVGVGRGDSREYFIDSLDKIGSGNGWVYYNEYKQIYEALFTEAGLVSDTGALLTRVVFDGDTYLNSDGDVVFDIEDADNNPLLQSDKTSLVVEWRIGIISLGQNDYVISESKTVPQLPTISERNILKNYINGSSITVNVPDGTTSIRSHCFYNMNRMKTVVLPKELGDSISIPDKAIEAYAFYGCASLTDIFYKGSEEDWNANITINSEGNTSLLDIISYPEQTDEFIAAEGQTDFGLSHNDIHQVVSVTVGSVPTTEYTVDTSGDTTVVKLDTAPSAGSDIVIVYQLPNRVHFDYVEETESEES